MTLTIDSSRTSITIDSTLLDNFIANPGNYTNVAVRMYVSDISSYTEEVYDSSNPITSSTNVQTNGGVETIVPGFLNASEFAQGQYKVEVILTDSSGITTDQGCLFVEDTIKCDIDNLRSDVSLSDEEKVLLGLDYFLLSMTASCDCECDKLIDLYNNLILRISNNDCSGC